MSDADTPEERPPMVLGTIGPGPHDTGLGGPPARPVSPPPEEQPERPRLPRGALVTLQRSGGMVFRTRDVAVYRDGRVTYDADGPGGERARAVWLLSEGELADLQRDIAAVDWRAEPGRPSPDAYSYEVTARVGRRVRRLVCAEGAIPETVEPLLRRLAAYAPPGGKAGGGVL